MKHLLWYLLALPTFVFSQELSTKPYFYQIPEVPKTYTSETVVARMIDGLGFRYFWATEGLRTVDLAYEPNEEARTTRFTLEHIYDLCNIIKFTSLNLPVTSDKEVGKYSFEDLRNKTLENLKISSQAMKNPDANLSTTKMIFQRPDGSKNNMDFWYTINGPIEDAVWHVGQVVSFRRSSGNPLPKGVSVLMGTKKD